MSSSQGDAKLFARVSQVFLPLHVSFSSCATSPSRAILHTLNHAIMPIASTKGLMEHKEMCVDVGQELDPLMAREVDSSGESANDLLPWHTVPMSSCPNRANSRKNQRLTSDLTFHRARWPSCGKSFLAVARRTRTTRRRRSRSRRSWPT
jgi:hypothetical protein